MGRIGLIYSLASHEETLAFGRKMATLLPPNAVIALSGDLGAGKTTFVQGLALGLRIEENVQSPTFVILNIYQDRLFHFDLYRLKKPSDFTSMGFEEYFQKGGLCAIEWPDRIASLLPPETISIHFSYDGTQRLAEVLP
ncbi:MAG TPA: tRNA (adenosine(37)-N6)-threonylcarbamoyltransferase complex ATPase subunit type 1 TsaE [Chlamydiales bacterium]|nr:tRNA (adenosine(37)-N6)-threonylcarbamoyltransferase complex ATPase subunit type 1 TsaE [Chlamydiales bacterium]